MLGLLILLFLLMHVSLNVSYEIRIKESKVPANSQKNRKDVHGPVFPEYYLDWKEG